MAQSNRNDDRRGRSDHGGPPADQGPAGWNSAAERLLEEIGSYLEARTNHLVAQVTSGVVGATRRLTDMDSGGSGTVRLLGHTAKGIAAGENPASAAMKGGVRLFVDKARSLLSRPGRGRSGGRFMTITEDVDIGLPVHVVYNQWTRFVDAPQWSKSAQKVDQDDDTRTSWRAKMLWSTRGWTAKITEQVPDERVVWHSEGAKGVVHGAVTFHPLGANLTRVLVSLQYHPAGLFEKTGNLWRAQGRRARLDLKLFRRYVMMGEPNLQAEGWRGQIHEGKVVDQPDGGGPTRDRGEPRDTDEDEFGPEEDPEVDEYADDADYADDAEDEVDDYEEEDTDEGTDEDVERPRRRQRQRVR